MKFQALREFVSQKVRMSHVYQPVMIRSLIRGGGRAPIETIAKDLLAEDRSQIEYYSAIVKNMVGRVLTRHNVVQRQGEGYVLADFDSLSQEQASEILQLCEQKLAGATRTTLISEPFRSSYEAQPIKASAMLMVSHCTQLLPRTSGRSTGVSPPLSDCCAEACGSCVV
jgi:hypothetical protein